MTQAYLYICSLIVGTYSDVNEENVLQTCFTDDFIKT